MFYGFLVYYFVLLVVGRYVREGFKEEYWGEGAFVRGSGFVYGYFGVFIGRRVDFGKVEVSFRWLLSVF